MACQFANPYKFYRTTKNENPCCKSELTILGSDWLEVGKLYWLRQSNRLGNRQQKTQGIDLKHWLETKTNSRAKSAWP